MSHDPEMAGVAMTVTGPAVFGRDPDQILCWKPCCLRPEELESWLPVAVRRDRPRRKRLWTVKSPRCQPATTTWRSGVMCHPA